MFAKAFMIAATVMVQSSPAAQPEEPVLAKAPAAPARVAKVAVTEPAPVPDPMPAAPAAPVSVALPYTVPAFFDVPAQLTGGGAQANKLVGKVQSFYNKTEQYSAKFRQTYTNKAFGQKTTKDGKVYIKKPGKMRWDYKGRKGLRSTFVSDGQNAWMVEFDNRQYAHQSLNDSVLPVAVTFLFGKGDLQRDFNASIDSSGKFGSKRDQVVKLIPKKPSAQYKELYLVVDPGNHRVKESVVIEGNGNMNHFKFYEPNISGAIADKTFVVNVNTLKKQNFRRINPAKANKPGTP